MRLTALACLAIACSAAAASECRVVSVHDGDTLTVLEAGRQTKVRLAGIDAPELGQPFGRRAREALAGLVHGRDIELDVTGRDRYGRTIARVVGPGGADVGHELVAAGMAWHYTRYSHDTELAEAEREARAARRGLWADVKPVAPWEWRAKERVRPRRH
jgi:micrococcal nuclease